jgi:5-methylcytosine-specific restriction protein A
LFEVFKKSEFTFIGEVELADPPFQEKQLDKNKELRKVWVFPLRIKRSDAKAIVKKESIEKLFQEKLKKLKKLGLTNEELLQIIQSDAPKSTSKRTVLTNVYERDPKIVEAALRRAGGICQLCEKEAPFMKKNNEPYLEVHHIVWLSKGGSDTLDNTVALCPNCHRKMHALNLEEDILKLKNKAETPLV